MLWIATTAPRAAPASTPRSPATTSRTWRSSGTQTQITSARSPTSRGEPAAFAPAATSSATGPAATSNTTVSNPAATRFAAIGLPWFPSPMNPARSAIGPTLSQFT